MNLTSLWITVISGLLVLIIGQLLLGAWRYIRKNGFKGIKLNVVKTWRNFTMRHWPRVEAHHLYTLFKDMEKIDPRKFPRGMKIAEERWLEKQLKNPKSRFKPGEKEYLSRRMIEIHTLTKAEWEKVKNDSYAMLVEIQKANETMRQFRSLPPR